MPYFRYSAADRSGKVSDGTIEAPTADDAMLSLVRQGYSVRQMIKVPDPGPGQRKPVAAQPKPQRQDPPRAVLPAAARPVPATRAAPAPKKAVIKTPPGSDKDRFFLFSQLGQQLKAGINPAQALSDIGKHARGRYGPSLDEASKAAMEGRPISEVFAKYPYLYPEHVVGLTRAGEQGGFLPDACMTISDQAQTAHKFKRWYWWIWALAINALLSIPGMWLATRAMVRTWEKADERGSTASFTSTLQDMSAAYLEKLIWPVGPVALVVFAISFVLWRVLSAMPTKRFRHNLSLKWPVIGARARHECLTVFSWTMSRLAQAGLSPKRSWELAAEAVPNIAMRDRLAAFGTQLGHNERLSETMFREKLFPDEYAPVVATAELTGDVPGAFDQLTQTSRTEFETAQNYAKARSGCWGLLGCMLTSAILLAMFWMMWYHELPAKVLEGMDPPGTEQNIEP